MPERFVFIHPQTLISIFREVVDDDTRLLFRRYTPSGHEAGTYVFVPDDRAAQEYIDGGYADMYLTLGAVPEYPQDWQFFHRAGHEMISVDGCRVSGNILEEASMRTVTRISQADSLFNRIDRRIKKICRRGMHVINRDRVDLTMWYDPRVATMEMRSSLESTLHTWVPATEEEVQAAKRPKNRD